MGLFPMKTSTTLFLAATLLCGWATSNLAADRADAYTPPRWNVRVETLMATVPEGKALALLPDLRDESKAGPAVDRLQEMIKAKEATLSGYSLLVSLDRQKATSESVLSWVAPFLPEDSTRKLPEAEVTLGAQQDNGGCTVEFDPTVSANGDSVELNVSVLRRDYAGLQANSSNPAELHFEQPVLIRDQAASSLTCHRGQWTLLSSHKVPGDEKALEVFVIRATALPLTPMAKPSSTPTDTRAQNVHVETSMISLSEDKALALLPDLCDEGKIEAACQRLDAMISSQEAVLTGHPSVTTLSGQTATYQMIHDAVYPSQFVVAPSKALVQASSGNNASKAFLYPTKFDRWAVGTSLVVEPVVLEDGQSISLNLSPQRSEVRQTDSYHVWQKTSDLNTTLELPRIFTAKDSTSVTVHDGQKVLLGVHRPDQPDGRLELFIVQAKVTSAP